VLLSMMDVLKMILSRGQLMLSMLLKKMIFQRMLLLVMELDRRRSGD
jgi:hypothetical protein